MCERENFLALRRNALIIAADREFNHGTEPIPVMPAFPGIYRPPVDGINERLAMMERHRAEMNESRKGERYRVGTRKPPEERMATMVRKSELLMAEMQAAQIGATFVNARERYYSNRSAALRLARECGMDTPDIPMAPVNLFEGAKPHHRMAA